MYVQNKSQNRKKSKRVKINVEKKINKTNLSTLMVADSAFTTSKMGMAKRLKKDE